MTVEIRPAGSDALQATIRPLEDDNRLSIAPSSLILSLWQESADIIRGSLRHPATGITAHFQGSSTLVDLSAALDLMLT